MPDDERQQIRSLFLVGGYSSNSAKASLDESRRIELRLDFYGIDERQSDAQAVPAGDVGSCALR